MLIYVYLLICLMSHETCHTYLRELRSALVLERERERKKEIDDERGKDLIFVRNHTCLHEFAVLSSFDHWKL